MANLVEILQAEAIDRSVPLSTLLRKVKLIASKLNLQDTVKWVDAELGGYGQEIADYPPYRHVEGKVKVFSPFHGWQTPGGDSRILTALSKRQIADSVSALEDLISRDPDGELTLEVDYQNKELLLKNNAGWTDIHTEVQRSTLVSILDQVRTLVLNWSLELDETGITGEGVKFSDAERELARAPSISITHFSGNLHAGDVTGVQNRVVQGSTDTSSNVNSEGVFKEIERIADSLDRETAGAIKDLVAEMRMSTDQRPRFLAAYGKIVGFAADHAGILPFIPALAAMIPS